MSGKQHNDKSIKGNGSRMSLQLFGEKSNKKGKVTSSREARVKNGKPTGDPPEE